jgi:quercetin dioxygenase-like cupin family protein
MMRIIRMGSGTARVAPMEGGPRVEVLVGEGDTEGANLSVAHVLVPPGGGMPEHEHGESEALVLAQSGRVEIEVQGGAGRETLEPGAMALIGVGERVRLENPSSSEPASLLAFFAPPGFVRAFASWPPAERTS